MEELIDNDVKNFNYMKNDFSNNKEKIGYIFELYLNLTKLF